MIFEGRLVGICLSAVGAVAALSQVRTCQHHSIQSLLCSSCKRYLNCMFWLQTKISSYFKESVLQILIGNVHKFKKCLMRAASIVFYSVAIHKTLSLLISYTSVSSNFYLTKPQTQIDGRVILNKWQCEKKPIYQLI